MPNESESFAAYIRFPFYSNHSALMETHSSLNFEWDGANGIARVCLWADDQGRNPIKECELDDGFVGSSLFTYLLI